MSETANMERAEMPKETGAGKGLFARILLFIRQVVLEMKKVVYPTREELWTYFLVVLVFVGIIMLFVGLIDLGFGYLANFAFTQHV